MTIKLFDAVKKMRQLSDAGVPFSFEYASYNATKRVSNGIKTVDKALLRKGLHKDKSDKADILIAYHNYNNETDRLFYLPLLTKFNNINITI
jgi:hypothetical protein